MALEEIIQVHLCENEIKHKHIYYFAGISLGTGTGLVNVARFNVSVLASCALDIGVRAMDGFLKQILSFTVVFA